MSTRREFITESAASILSCMAAGAVAATGGQGATNRTTITVRKISQTDLVVSRIAYGTAMIGLDQRSAELIPRAVRAMRTAYESGITFFDLADTYAAGRSETALGSLLRDSHIPRQKIIIQSKVGIHIPDGSVPGDLPNPADPVRADLSFGHIIKSVEESLSRLHTDYLDILLLHAFDQLTKPDEVAHACEQLCSKGMVRYFGVSNHNVLQMELLRKYIKQPLVTNQMWISLANYSAIVGDKNYGGLVDYCQLHDIQVQSYSPLKGSNVLQRPALLNPLPDANPEEKELATLLSQIASRHNCSPAAIMLAWLLSHPAGIVPIIGTSNPGHIIDNCIADRVQLTREEWSALFYSAAPLQPKW